MVLLSPRLARRAQRRFAADGAVTILLGDGGALLIALERSHRPGWGLRLEDDVVRVSAD